MIEKKENDSRKELERFRRYFKKQEKIFRSAVYFGFDVGDTSGAVEDDDNNISMANNIVDILLKNGIIVDHKYTPPLQSERIEHIFALVREMLRTY